MENREFGKEPNGIGQFHLPLWLRMKRKIEDYKLEGKAKQKIPQMLELLQHPWDGSLNPTLFFVPLHFCHVSPAGVIIVLGWCFCFQSHALFFLFFSPK